MADSLPIDINVTLLPAEGAKEGLAEGTAEGAGRLGAYLAAVADGNADAPDLVAVAVGPDSIWQDRPDLDPFLPAAAAAVIGAARLTGEAGEVAEATARLGARSGRVLFLGVGDGSPRAWRRAGAELGRRAARGAAGSKAGSIAAALFLREFTGGRKWARLDVAGPARASSDDGTDHQGRHRIRRQAAARLACRDRGLTGWVAPDRNAPPGAPPRNAAGTGPEWTRQPAGTVRSPA